MILCSQFESGSLMCNVLIVDDNKFDIEFNKTLLSLVDDNLHITSAYSVHEAFEVLKESIVDYIISDYQMPEIDGLKFLASLREKDINIPFILLTGFEDMGLKEKALSYGAMGYFVKHSSVTLYQKIVQCIHSGVRQTVK